jgi:predicted alpha/beta-fold hydrolase
VLIVNAQNDSFLGPGCYPVKEAESNRQLFLEMPRYGGHVGFFETKKCYYSEKRAIKFMQEAS